MATFAPSQSAGPVKTGEQRIHPLLKKLSSFYCSLAEDLPLPPFAALQPGDLSWLEGNFCIVAVLQQEKDYRFERCGIHMRLFSRHNLESHYLSEIETKGDFSEIRSDFDQVVLARRPRYSSGSMIWENALQLECEWLILPFTGTHNRITHLLVAEKAKPAQGGRVPQPNVAPLPRLEMRAMIWPAFHRPSARTHRPAIRQPHP